MEPAAGKRKEEANAVPSTGSGRGRRAVRDRGVCLCRHHPFAGAGEGDPAYLDSAQAYIQKGNLKAAEIELRNAEREAPQDAHIRALLAQVYLKLGDFKLAEREARAARDLKGAEADYLLPLAEAMLRQGKAADIAVQIKPGDRPPELESKVRMILAMAASGLHDRAKAEALSREAVALDENAPGPKIALARLLLGGNAGEAEKLVDAVIAADPRSAEAIAIKGEILAKRGDVDGAMQRFGEALAIDPNNPTAHLSRANINLSRGDYPAVDQDLDPILKLSPENFGANYLRALENFKKRDFAAADKILDRVSPNFSFMAEGLYVQAATKYGLKQYGQAADAVAKYVARVPQNPFGARLAATIALRRGAPDVAVQYLTGYLAKSSPDPATLTLLGNAYVALKKPALALEQYEKAAALDPENLSLKTMVAASEIDAGAGRKGLDELEEGIRYRRRGNHRRTDAGVDGSARRAWRQRRRGRREIGQGERREPALSKSSRYGPCGTEELSGRRDDLQGACRQKPRLCAGANQSGASLCCRRADR